jgi:hypothetical protein
MSFSVYPNAYDSTNQLVPVVDLRSAVVAEVITRRDDAIKAIESELGLQPSGTYTTVRARLDDLDRIIAGLIRRIRALEEGGIGVGTIHIKENGSTVLANAKILNFSGAVSVTHPNSVQADITIVGGLVMIQIQESTVAAPAQAAFLLSTFPDDETAVFMFIEGIKQDYGSDYTVSGKDVTYLGAPLIGGEVIEFWFLAVGSTVHQKQESFVAGGGQVAFTLSEFPQDDTAVQMYVNGIKQEHGVDYTVVSNSVTYAGTPLNPGDVVEFWYIFGISGGGIGVGVQDNGVQVLSAAANLNFIGSEWVIGTDGNNALIALSEDGYARVQETLPVVGDGQFIFTLSSTPLDNTAVEFFIEGIKQKYGTDYTVAGTVLTYNDVDILLGDVVDAVYQTDTVFGKLLYTKIQETLTVTGDAQTIFNISYTPSDNTKVEFFIEGIKQQYGVDYTVAGTTITYNDVDILIGDVIEAVYFLGSSATTYEPKLETLPAVFNGQTDFYLGQVPYDITGVELFIEGIKQKYGTDYSVNNSVITYNDVDVNAGDVVDAVYITGDGSQPTWAQVLAWGNASGGTSPVISDGDVLYGQNNLILDTLNPDGYVLIDGKLTVTGLIDPTGLVLDQQASVPGGYPANTKGTIWIRESDGYLVFTNRDGITSSLQSVGGNESLAETLLIGNVTGGKDIVFSIGDDITTPDAVGSSTPLYIRTGDSSTSNSGEIGLITGVAAAGGNTGTVWMQSRDHTGVSGGSSGEAYIHSGYAYVNSGAAYVYSGDAETGVSGNAYVKVGNGYTGTGEARLTGGNIVPGGSGTVAATYVTAGNNYGTGDAGYLKVQSGLAINGDGGNLDLLAGAGSNDGGYLNVVAGYSTAGHGGNVIVAAGAGATAGGNMTVYAGDSQLEPGGNWTGRAGNGSNDDGGWLRLAGGNSYADGYNGGNIELYSGNGGAGGNDGYIIFYRGSDEVARWDDGGSQRCLLTSDGSTLSFTEFKTKFTPSSPDTTYFLEASGPTTLQSENKTGSDSSGVVSIFSGASDSGTSGYIRIITGATAGSTGGLEIRVSDSTGSFGGTAELIAGDGPSGGGVMDVEAGDSSAGAGGAAKFYAGDGYTGAGTVYVYGGDIIAGGNGEAGSLQMYAGDNFGTGYAGNADFLAGNAIDGYGGAANFRAGSGTIDGGDLNISAGNATLGEAGTITMSAGSGVIGGNVNINCGSSSGVSGSHWSAAAGDSSFADGGDVRLLAGASSADGHAGGNVEIHAGTGSGVGGRDGYVILYRGLTEVARWDNGGSERLLLGTQVVELAGSGGAWSYITTPKDIFDNGLEISTGESNISVPTGNIRIASGDVLALSGGSASGDMWFVSGNTEDGRSGNLTIGSGVSAGNTSGNVSLTSADGYTTVGSITIETGDITYEGNLGGIRIATGNNPSTGSLGNIDIIGGDSGQNAGYINIWAGDGYLNGGTVTIRGGNSSAGSAQDVTIYAGSGVTTAGGMAIAAGNASDDTGGEISLLAGSSTGSGINRNGGDATLGAGSSAHGIGGRLFLQSGAGDSYDGYIILKRGSTEVARWNEYDQLDVNGNRIVDVEDPIDPQDVATKSYVDGYSGGGGSVFIPGVAGSFSTEDVTFSAIGALVFNADTFSGDQTFQAVLEVSDGYDGYDGYTAEVRLYDIAGASVVADSTLSSISEIPELQSASVSLGSGNKVYEVQLRITPDGGPGNIATCKFAGILVT